MKFDDLEFFWEDDNIEHIALHNVLPEDAEFVVRNAGRGILSEPTTMKRTPKKQFWEMSAAERAELAKELDKEFVRTYPLTPEMRAQWNRAKRKPGRPRIGKGSKSVLISVEQDLLKNADAFARKNKLSRSQLIAGLLRSLPKAG